MSEKREQWERIQAQAPGVADFLTQINQAFGKPSAVRVELFGSGEVIESGGRLRVDQPGLDKVHICRDCRYWRKDRPADGAGVCTAKNKGMRRSIADWPTHVACRLFDIKSGADDVCGN
jgi:hypothetical protein